MSDLGALSPFADSLPDVKLAGVECATSWCTDPAHAAGVDARRAQLGAEPSAAPRRTGRENEALIAARLGADDPYGWLPGAGFHHPTGGYVERVITASGARQVVVVHRDWVNLAHRLDGPAQVAYVGADLDVAHSWAFSVHGALHRGDGPALGVAGGSTYHAWAGRILDHHGVLGPHACPGTATCVEIARATVIAAGAQPSTSTGWLAYAAADGGGLDHALAVMEASEGVDPGFAVARRAAGVGHADVLAMLLRRDVGAPAQVAR